MAFDIKTLEFDKIVKKMKPLAQTSLGKAKLDALTPSPKQDAVEAMLHETDEARRFIMEGLEPSFGGVTDLTDAIKRARIEGVLSVSELIQVHNHVRATTRIKREMTRLSEREETTIDIETYAHELVVCKSLGEAIHAAIDESGDVRDSASAELASIRRHIDNTERKIKTTLDHVLKKEAKRLTDQIITIRNNRYVIPVKPGEKNNVRGTVIDYSSSGETAYIEPEAIRELTSTKDRLEADERREIERILFVLTLEVKDHADTLSANLELLGHLDMLFAKGTYAHATESTKPKLTNRLHLMKARHPLIPKDEVVANTITFDDDINTIIITGSNTGGKTVALKTVGLLAMMAQSGLLIPTLPGSETRCFTQIRADIGDEQSIEQSLSTFSSHMKNIVSMLKGLKPGGLILLDELGGGTDPSEGASLAMSILEYLNDKNVHVIATTHYPELKAYAYTKFSIVNASVEFDEKTLQPTYRLLMRTPGESHALLIASRLGLDSAIVEHAKKHVLTQKTEVGELIDNLKRESKKLDDLIIEYEKTTRAIEQERRELSEKKREVQAEKETLKERLTRENRKAMDSLQKDAKALIDELQAMKSQSFKAHELAEAKHKLKSLQPDRASSDESSTRGHSYKAGDRVYLLKYNRHGELVKKQKDGRWRVRMGRLESVLDEDAFEYTEPSTPHTPEPTPAKTTVNKSVPSELDLRGMRVHEAKEALDKYLDDCLVAGMPFASVIHGYGTLALRKMVKETVAEHQGITEARDGKGNEGGQGVTIVYFS